VEQRSLLYMTTVSCYCLSPPSPTQPSAHTCDSSGGK